MSATQLPKSLFATGEGNIPLIYYLLIFLLAFQIPIILYVISMNHMEGGWPKDVKTEMIEHKNKFIRKTLKEDMFKYTFRYSLHI